MLKNKRKSLHIGLWITGLLLAATGIFSFWVSYHYKNIIRQQLPSLVAKNTDSLYNVSLGDISINVLTRTVTLKNVRFAPDSVRRDFLKQNNRLPAKLLSVAITEIHIAGIEWENLASNSSFDCKYIIINSPTILIDGAPKPLDSLTGKDTSTKKAAIEMISAGKIDILNPIVTYHYVSDTSDYSLWIKGGKVLLSDWKLETGKGLDTSTFFFARNAEIALDSFNYVKKGSPYGIGASGLAFSTAGKSIDLRKVFIHITGSKENFYKEAGQQKDIYDLFFPSIKIAGLDWKGLLNKGTLHADTMQIADPSLEIYFSRLYAPNTKSKVGNYPHQLLTKIGLPLDIQTMQLTNGHFKYTEMSATTHKEGVIRFEQVSGTMNNITNIDTLIAKNEKCYIKLKGKYMDHGDIAATFMLLLSDKKGYFTVDGTAINVDAADVNQPAKALALTEVTSFHLNKLDMHVEGNEDYGKGKFTMLYDDLNITFLKMNEDNKTDKKGKGALSFLANTLALYSSNPMPGKEVRQITTSIKRDPYKGFFSLIWKNVFMGAKNTALRSPELVENVKGAVKAETPEKKKTFLRKIFGKKK